LSSHLLTAIRSEVEKLATRHRVSKSWVVATLLADALGVSGQEQFTDADANAKGRPS
jgi:hypothetical protein